MKPLKETTIFNALSVLNSLERVKALDFALSYWPSKYKPGIDGVAASLAGRNILFKLKKYGYVTAFTRRDTDHPLGVFVFEVSEIGYQFLASYH